MILKQPFQIKSENDAYVVRNRQELLSLQIGSPVKIRRPTTRMPDIMIYAGINHNLVELFFKEGHSIYRVSRLSLDSIDFTDSGLILPSDISFYLYTSNRNGFRKFDAILNKKGKN